MQVRLDVLHADTFLLHIRQVYLRDGQRLELPLLLRLKPFGYLEHRRKARDKSSLLLLGRLRDRCAKYAP